MRYFDKDFGLKLRHSSSLAFVASRDVISALEELTDDEVSLLNFHHILNIPI